MSMSVSAVLRERGAASWAAAVSHPMVAEIGAGSLPHETFRYYFEQNVLYLEDYARAIALIIGRAPDLAAITVLTRFLSQIVDTELPANYAFLARLGGPAQASRAQASSARASSARASSAQPDPAAVMTPATYAYTRHLLDTAGRHDLPAGLAAVLPCQWSYGELATRLAAAMPADPLYADWIAMFAGDGYDELVQASTSLLDQHADSADAALMTSLAAVFDRSTRYELDFWDMAHAGPGGRPPGPPDRPSGPSAA